jgi:fumarylacetoacetase
MGLLRSWVEGANDPEGPFPLNNLPCGAFAQGGGPARCGVAIGGFVLDLAGLETEGLVRVEGGPPVFGKGAWNGFMARGPRAWADLRARLTELLAEGAGERELVAPHLLPLDAVTLRMPFRVAGFTDFYAGRHHAENAGALMRGAPSLPPNWMHLPIGYNGRASSVVVSGTPVRRPWGQVKPAGEDAPRFAPSGRFDVELELGAVVGVGSAFGRPVTVAEAQAMIFGYVLLNDWSARDVQAWEYQPLGPFQAKAAATTVGPWIVTAEALRPFRATGQARDVALLPYLEEPGPLHHDIRLEVALRPEGGGETVVTRTNARELTWSAAQQLAHHTVSGCPMEVGDLLGSGTISGPGRDGRGSLLELSWGGREPFAVEGGLRSFLEDGDTVTLRGHAQGNGFRLGFGEAQGTVLPAWPDPYRGDG